MKEVDIETCDAFGNRLPICHTQIDTCLDCGVPLNPENDSGWAGFVPGGQLVQNLCKSCDARRSSTPAKKCSDVSLS